MGRRAEGRVVPSTLRLMGIIIVSRRGTTIRGYKSMEEPTTSLIEGVDISCVLTMKSHLCDSQWEKLPRIIREYLELHYNSKMPPSTTKSKSRSKRAKAYYKLKSRRLKATEKQA